MLNLFKRLNKYFDKGVREDENIDTYLRPDYKIYPRAEAIRIALIYGFAGILWILLSDEILSRIVTDVGTFKKAAIYKGWAYVLITVLIVYLLVVKRLKLFKKALHKIYENFDELASAHEELIALEEELRSQYDELSNHEKKMNELVYYDTLTELPNRVLFEIKVTELVSKISRADKQFALVYLDIDNFKNINDTLGHVSGDLLLKHIAGILKEKVQSPDFSARLSGDEFAIVFDDVADKNDVIDKIQGLLKYLRKPWELEGQDFFISFSIGIAMYPEHGDNLAVLLKHSDMAMYYVKKNLKDNYSFYFHEMQEKNIKYIKMINELRRAIDNKEFELYYQPIIDLKTGHLTAAEALIRWIHPQKGLIPPMEFIPIAEETGLIYDIGKWVLKTAFLQKKNWEDKGYPPIKMSINISGKRVTNNELVDEIRELIAETGLRSDEIQVEVTETAIMNDMDVSTEILKQIKSMGVKIALDDFGTGYSSLTYLQKLPIDVVKLDRDFIRHISNAGDDHVIVESIIKLTHDLGLKLVAEGIETREQLEFLKISQCDYGQGYLFSRPVKKEEMERMLELKKMDEQEALMKA